MLCARPALMGDEAFPCGQCLACRVNRRRIWTHRCVLEAGLHAESCFVTLTYDQAHVPADGSLRRSDVRAFIKALRKRFYPARFRYYGVGEYGPSTWRPHYHVILFGVSPLAGDLIHEVWGRGHTQTGYFSRQAAQYVSGYVTKKLVKEEVVLGDREPEFSFMSLHPGIGAGAMQAVADVLSDEQGSKLINSLGDVPTSLSHGGRPAPLGNYLRRKLRDHLGFETSGGQSKPAAIRQAQMRALRDASGSSKVYRETLPMVNQGRLIQVRNRARIFAKKEKL